MCFTGVWWELLWPIGSFQSNLVHEDEHVFPEIMCLCAHAVRFEGFAEVDVETPPRLNAEFSTGRRLFIMLTHLRIKSPMSSQDLLQDSWLNYHPTCNLVKSVPIPNYKELAVSMFARDTIKTLL